jgi:hypothetical protein
MQDLGKASETRWKIWKEIELWLVFHMHVFYSHSIALDGTKDGGYTVYRLFKSIGVAG